MQEVKKITLDLFLEKLGKILKDSKEDKNKIKFIAKLTWSFLNWKIKVLWKIDNDTISNVIKFWTQSLFVHTTFCEFINNDLYVYGSENWKWVIIDKYNKKTQDSWFYVIKTLNIPKLSNFEKNKEIIEFFFLKDAKEGFITRYNQFINFFKNKEKIFLEDLIDFEIYYLENEKNIKQTKKGLKNLIKQINPKIIKWERKNKKLQELFFRWWMFKYIIASYWISYDFSWAMLINFSPFRKLYKISNNEKLFCSEFIAFSLLYAWYYPFDMVFKSPSMVSPGDLMDSSLLWENSFEVIENKTWKVIKIRNLEDKRKFFELIENQ
jgi:hypothetical protein